MNSKTVALALIGLCALRAPALEFQRERTSASDLEISGLVAGLAANEHRFVRWQDLRDLPTSRVEANGEFVAGSQTLTVVFLDDLFRALSPSPKADTLLARCADGYASVFTGEFITKYRPFLVLEINGKGPKDWPPPGLDYNPGPYVITVSARLAPEAAGYPDLEHKKPWGVTSLEVASFADRYRGVFSGPWAALASPAQDGRRIWINSCASCHVGPAGIFGGTKAGRPFAVIAAYAAHDRAYFKTYVRNPKSLVPCAQMEPHPRYSDDDLSGLIAFIAAGSE